MAAPTFIQESESVWDGTVTPKDRVYDIVTGDILIGMAVGADSGGFSLTAPVTQAGATTTAWTAIESSPSAPASNCPVGMWWAEATSSGSTTTRFARGGATPQLWGCNVLTFRDSDGIGDTARTNSSGTPGLNVTTTQADSAIVVILGDWAAITGADAWLNNAGLDTPVVAHPGDAATYAVRGVVFEDAGAIGTYDVGMSSPGGQTYNIMAVEVLGIPGERHLFGATH